MRAIDDLDEYESLPEPVKTVDSVDNPVDRLDAEALGEFSHKCLPPDWVTGSMPLMPLTEPVYKRDDAVSAYTYVSEMANLREENRRLHEELRYRTRGTGRSEGEFTHYKVIDFYTLREHPNLLNNARRNLIDRMSKTLLERDLLNDAYRYEYCFRDAKESTRLHVYLDCHVYKK